MSVFSEVINEMKGLYSDLTLDPSGTSARHSITTTHDLVVYEDRKPGDWETVEKKTGEVTVAKDVTGAPKLIIAEFASMFEDFKKEAESKQNNPIENLKAGGFDISDENVIEGEVAQDSTEGEPGQEVLSNEEKLAMLSEIIDGDIPPRREIKKAEHEQTIQKQPHGQMPAKRNTAKLQPPPSIQTVYNFSEKQLQAIKDTVAKGASDSEFEMLMYLANRYQLDPILKEIFYSPQLKTIMTSRDGYLKIAHRDPTFEGVQSMAVCENDDFELDVPNCSVKHKFGKGDRGKVLGAWAIVYRTGKRQQLAWAATKEQLNNNPAWKYVSAMSCKCAENFALKRAFSISGLVTQEEFGIEDNVITETVPIIDAEYMEVSAEEVEA